MKINEFIKVESLDQAYDLLQEDKENIVIGGGAWLKLTNKEVNKIIDLESLNLRNITEKNDRVIIGSMSTLRDIELNESIQHLSDGILVEAIKNIMGVSIRNLATIGGSIMGKYSFSDILTPLLVMDTRLEFHKNGIMSLEAFLSSKPIKDVLLSVIVSKNKSKGYFYKMQKTRMDFAVINVAVSKSEKIDISVGARPSIAMKPVKAIEFINNQSSLTEDIIKETAKIAVNEIKFGSNSRASSEYRKNICEVYIRRGLEEVINNES